MTDWYPQSADPAGGPHDADPRTQAPPSGYTVPPQRQPPYTDALASPTYIDPLVSPDFAGWWSRGVSIARRGWKPLATLQAAALLLALVAQAPVAAYAALASERMNRALTASDPSAPLDLTPLLTVLGLGLVGAMLAIIVTAIVTIATVHIGVSVATGAAVRISDALRLAARRVFPLLGWQLLAIPIYLVAVCVCFFPVFYIAAVFVVLPVVVAIERTNAISRCFSLFHGDVGLAIGRIATILGLTIGVAVVGGLIGTAVDAAVRAAVPGEGGVIAGSVCSTLLAATIGGAMAILIAPLTLTAYAGMRARQAPLNAMVIAHELGIAPATWPASPWPPAPPMGPDVRPA
jgi:hypothetical protein